MAPANGLDFTLPTGNCFQLELESQQTSWRLSKMEETIYGKFANSNRKEKTGNETFSSIRDGNDPSAGVDSVFVISFLIGFDACERV